jgi:tetratricopeptide (TPR) repeat protein
MSSGEALTNAVKHHQAGRLADAERAYRQLLAQQPNHREALHLLGILSAQSGRPTAAVELIRLAIQVDPEFADAHYNLGNVYKTLGQLDEAVASYHNAIRLKPHFAEAHNNLGLALKDKGRVDEAIAFYEQAIRFKPEFTEAHNNLGNSLENAGRIDEAMGSYQQAIRLKPNFALAHYNLGNALRRAGRIKDAIASYKKAIQLKPDLAGAYNNLGNVFRENGQLDDAIAAFKNAVALIPTGSAEMQANLSLALKDKGLFGEAIAACRWAIALHPDYAEAHFHLSSLLLTTGAFAEGWNEFEWRWIYKGFPPPRRNFTQAQWDGSLLEGRTLLIDTEQGFGDAIQFVRYLPLVAHRSGKIILECQPELVRLFESLTVNCQIIPRGNSLPMFDLHCPLLSLPRVFKTDASNIPARVPYIFVRENECRKWDDRLAAQSAKDLNVGVAWAGSRTNSDDHNRSIQLAMLAPLSQAREVLFVSLQKGEASAQAQHPPPGLELMDWTSQLTDFADTAALISQLDLVITVDTAIAHLAGAMGKPVWVLLPFVPDWRWLLDRDDSPWYPTMRLFRQPTPADWKEVIDQVSYALSHYSKVS